MQIGLLARTPRGRMLTASGWEHLGLAAPATAAGASIQQPGLFDG
jgi:Holliday junction DNA helicase RuvB